MARADGDGRMRALAAALAVGLGGVVLWALATGVVWAGARSRYLYRLDQPVLYWAWVGLGLVACGYFAAVALGLAATEGARDDPGSLRARRQRDATLFCLAGCAVLGWFWWAERPEAGVDSAHAILGLGVLGLTGFVLALAPAAAGRRVRLGGAMVLAGAVVAAWLI